MSFKNLILGAAAAASVFAAVPAAAVSTIFASVDTTSSGRDFVWTRNGSGGTFTTLPAFRPGSVAALFSLVGSPVPLSVAVDLLMTGSTVGDPLGISTGNFSQQLDSLTFSLTSRQNFTFGANSYSVGDVLLSGVVSSAKLTGTLGTTGPVSLNGDTTTGSTITLSSPLVTFAPGSEFAFDFGLSNLNTLLASLPQTAVGTFTGNDINGTFSSDPGATFNVPEPGTWAMMITGMGLVGIARRRRRTSVAA